MAKSSVTLNSGSGGAVIVTDEISVEHYQVVKMAFGAFGTATPVTTSAPFPVDLQASNATVTVAAHAVTNAGTFATQVDGDALTALQLIDDVVATLGTTTYTETTTKGNVIGAVRNDTLAALANTDNEIAPLQVNASGALYIQEGSALDVSAATLTVNAHAVTNAGTFVVQEDGAALTALQLIDDSIFADDAAFTLASSKVDMAGAIRDDTLSTLTAVEGDAVPLRVNSTGALHITGAAAGTEFNEDTAHSTGAAGPQVLGVRRDADTSPVDADNDYHTLIFNNLGALKVEVFDSGDSHTVDNAGTFVVQEDGAALTALQLIDDAVATLGTTTYTETTTKGNVMGVVRNDTLAALAGTDNEIAPLQVNASGALYIQEGSALDVSAATLTVNAHAVTNAGTFVVQEDGSALTALQLIDDPVFADDAAFTLASSKVSMAGAIRDDALSTLTAIEGDAVPLRVGSTGALHVTGSAGVTEFNEDTAHSTGAAGNIALGVRRDADTSPVSDDADYHTMIFDATGKLKVEIFNGGETHTVTDDGSFTLAANSGVDIGDVDVLSVVPGTGATNLGKAVNDPSASGDVGAAALVIRDDVLATLSPIDGDYVHVRVNSVGALWVATDASSDEIHLEDVAHSSGDAGIMPLAVRNDDLAALAGTDGDYAPLQVTENGALLTCPAANDAYLFETIDDASSGDNTIVAAVASRKIRVVAGFFVSAGTVNARFESGAAGTALTGQMNLVANSGFTLPFNPAGWFETAVNTLLNLELSAAVSVDGSITYILVP